MGSASPKGTSGGPTSPILTWTVLSEAEGAVVGMLEGGKSTAREIGLEGDPWGVSEASEPTQANLQTYLKPFKLFAEGGVRLCTGLLA
jgi:hypothetical protein